MRLILLASGLALATPALAKKPPAGFAPTLPAAPTPAPRAADGAIFSASAGYAPLVFGTRAHGVGDPLTIALVESTTSAKTASSKTARNGGFSLTPPTAGPFAINPNALNASGQSSFKGDGSAGQTSSLAGTVAVTIAEVRANGLTPPTAGPFAINPNALNASGQSSFKGDGSAGQTSSLAGTVAVTIAEVRANGTALVKGEKRMLLSQGQEWIQFSGIVRLADIDADNTVRSAQVADARIEYAGNGSIQRAGREGWLSRFFNMITPF